MPILSGAAKSIACCSYWRQSGKTAVFSLRYNITRYATLRFAYGNISIPERRYHPLSLTLVEDVEGYRLGGFHPVHIGNVFQAKHEYKVLHKLGAGGFSTTWLARDTVDKKYVALKILKAEETASELPMP